MPWTAAPRAQEKREEEGKLGGQAVARLPCPHMVQLAASQPALETFPGSLEEQAVSCRFAFTGHTG